MVRKWDSVLLKRVLALGHVMGISCVILPAPRMGKTYVCKSVHQALHRCPTPGLSFLGDTQVKELLEIGAPHC